jgi:NitT/TauT family transport system ATP-binding protein
VVDPLERDRILGDAVTENSPLRRDPNLTSDEAIAIETRGLSKSYRTESGDRLDVLKDIDLTIRHGQFVSLIGPSGGGKSTLLEILAGLRQPTAGRVLIYGNEEDRPSAAKGVVFQKDAVFPWLTVQQNVLYGLRLKKIPKQERNHRAAAFLEMVGLTTYSNYFPKELSGGMRKRLAIAMVFANDPKILFMDEPFGSLDYTTKVELQSELLNLWRLNERTVVFVTHDLEEALYLSSEIHALRDGRIAERITVPFERPREFELRNRPNFREAVRSLWHHLKSPGAEKG